MVFWVVEWYCDLVIGALISAVVPWYSASYTGTHCLFFRIVVCKAGQRLITIMVRQISFGAQLEEKRYFPYII